MGRTEIRSGVALALTGVVLLAGCSVNVQKEKNGQDKNVDIRTPIGGIHVSKDADASDAGLALYPGARMRPNDAGNDKNANVNISGLGYGIKVVALEYDSDDSADKVLAFYRGQLKQYGDLLVCHTNHLNVNADIKDHDHGNSSLTCENSSGADTELKVGTRENQHIVAVEPGTKGCSFSLVYVRTHGKEAEI